MDKEKIIKVDYAKFVGLVIFALYFINCIRNPDEYHFISSVNLVIHEAGHFIFIFFGDFIHILGGSFLQILIPIIFSTYFFMARDNFSGGFILMWAGQSMTEVARYAADAIAMQLPLLGGDDVIHDWNWLLTDLNLLQYTSVISDAIYNVGIYTLIVGVVVSIVYIFSYIDRT